MTRKTKLGDSAQPKTVITWPDWQKWLRAMPEEISTKIDACIREALPRLVGTGQAQIPISRPWFAVIKTD
jgi:hypothetical protein